MLPDRSILIVDDDRDLVCGLEALLKELGYTVKGLASSGEEAIDQAARNPPDLVLMDIELGGKMDGIEAAKQIYKRLQIPVVYLTAHCDDQTLMRIRETASFGYILKPFQTKELAAAIDIAFRWKDHERSLTVSQGDLARIISKIRDSIVVTDLQGKVLFVNPAAEESLDRKRDALIGTRLNFPLQPQNSTEVLMNRANGKQGTADRQVVEIDWEGKPAYLVTFHDITERKQLIEQLFQSQKMEAFGKIAGGVAHDFNNLLTVIQGYSEMLLQAVKEGAPLRAEIEEIKKAADRSCSLTRQLLLFSRRQMTALKVFDLNVLILDMDKMFRRVIGEDIELTTVPEKELGMIKVDPSQLEQVLMNLVVNARDAMPKGGKLIIETKNIVYEEKSIPHSLGLTPGSWVMLAVSDTGIGMSAEVKEHLFEPFFTTKGQGKGTGLGLATCYGIVKQNQGVIDVYSEDGRGTSFKIYFKRCDEPAELLIAQKRAKEIPRGKETILVIEDEDALRKMAVLILRELGYRVLEASDGEAVLRLVENKAPGEQVDLLLMDVVMPKVDAKMLWERLKREQPALKVLFMSGYTDDAVIQHGILKKEVEFIQKPFGPLALSFKVREVLDQKSKK